MAQRGRIIVGAHRAQARWRTHHVSWNGCTRNSGTHNEVSERRTQELFCTRSTSKQVSIIKEPYMWHLMCASKKAWQSLNTRDIK